MDIQISVTSDWTAIVGAQPAETILKTIIAVVGRRAPRPAA
jgi:hypothetical protein